ncbi:MAG: tetraacyldisaccharide 4'-kinase [Alphaproteobacteria bacterium]|nr:tetraacyldisaccharide 4'-kinase [Alphaproteobacteria bacterium]MBQ3117461.1 tetraacyldisaccharide 4'-kinase [Alphaproteobacteria bacterium]MBQ6854481.1 tetraacyldisaccharide 4'-kinase [Alphaproteobacteria bacterium]MBQ8557752.1 tetraacyldisaccharide 4'-kinase [Alphaproteobacteria bacterium]MBR3913531.1 tetraacyldisaccharide 4'-kinase [Alphaproteobacteria bacterium]
MKTPDFWDCPNHFLSKLLKPFGHLYAYGTAYRFKHTNPYQASVPVICVGNLSIGGTGKTPVCLAIAGILHKQKKNFFFLNHGYKSHIQNVLVDLENHASYDVGDEAVLLAYYGPTVVDRHRARGAQFAVRKGAECIVMDDGFQNPSLIKTLSFVVVDGKKGFGNECVIPAGPLREPVLKGLSRADAIIIVGEDEWGVQFYLQRNKIDLPILTGSFVLNKRTLSTLKGKKVMAFAGIGQPQKFFDILKRNGINVVKTESYPDHYYYTRFDVERLIKSANGLPLLTTTKDAVKIPKDLLKHIEIIDGHFVFDKPQEAAALIKGVFE